MTAAPERCGARSAQGTTKCSLPLGHDGLHCGPVGWEQQYESPDDCPQLQLVLPVPPSANRWWRNVRGRMVKSRAAREYQRGVYTRAVNALASSRHGTPRSWPLFARSVPVKVTLTWYRSERKGDLDKRQGILLDALQGIAYWKDSQVVELHATIVKSAAPRMHVTVERCDAQTEA